MKICIVSHNAYGTLSGNKNKHIGGVEWQTTLTARWLAEKGHDITMITWKEGSKLDEVIDKIKVRKVSGKEEGIPVIRTFYPKWYKLIKVLNDTNADIYYNNCAEIETGQVALWCKKNGKPFIYSIASDRAVEKNLPSCSHFFERYLYKFALYNSKIIIAQTIRQQKMLKFNFNINSTVIPMPCPNPSYIPSNKMNRNKSQLIIWVGRLCNDKRPDLILNIAERLPQFQFKVIGPYHEHKCSRIFIQNYQKLHNIEYLGALTRDSLFRYYYEAFCLLCTSDHEGFPNTFLESLSTGLPIISTFDPDHIIKNFQLGANCFNTIDIVNSICHLFKNPLSYNLISQNTLKYFFENHSMEVVLPKFEMIFSKSLKRPMNI